MMLSDIEIIKDFLINEITELETDNNFYCQQNIGIPQFHKGRLDGKKLACEKTLEFIEDMKKSKKES